MEEEIIKSANDTMMQLHNEVMQLNKRIDKAINRISLIRMDRDTSIETHKALDEILNVLRGCE